MRRARISHVGFAMAMVVAALPALAQDFPPIVPGAGPDPCSEFLERGLPAERNHGEITVAGVRRFGLTDLETRALAVRAGWRSLRGAAGVSQTGDPDVGWLACGAAAGFATTAGGAGVRAVARRDRVDLAHAPALDAGGGAWITAAPGLVVWMSHPQGARRGTPRPLERGLEIGARWSGRGMEVWLVRESAADGRGTDRHRAGGALLAGPARVALELREAPLRASLGIAVGTRGLGVAAAVDEHPVLPGTTRLGAALRSPP